MTRFIAAEPYLPRTPQHPAQQHPLDRRTDPVRKTLAAITALVTAVLLTASTGASATARATNPVKIGGVLWASVGTGVIDLTPGVEALDLANYSYATKSLKGYKLKVGTVVLALCKIDAPDMLGNGVHKCESDLLDDDADGTVNRNDGDAWISLPARSQLLWNAERANDGPLFTNGGADVMLFNSVGKLISRFQYKVT